MTAFLSRAFERLERLTVKVVRAVLRGLGGSNPPRLPDPRRRLVALACFLAYLFIGDMVNSFVCFHVEGLKVVFDEMRRKPYPS
jgi:hypothetical protein